MASSVSSLIQQLRVTAAVRFISGKLEQSSSVVFKVGSNALSPPPPTTPQGAKRRSGRRVRDKENGRRNQNRLRSVIIEGGSGRDVG